MLLKIWGKNANGRGLSNWISELHEALKFCLCCQWTRPLTLALIYLSRINWYVQQIMWHRGLNTLVAWVSPHLPRHSTSPQVSLVAFRTDKLTEITAEQSVRQGRVAFLQQGQLMGVGQQHVSEQGWIVQALRRWSYFSGRWVGLLCSWWLPLPGARCARHSYTTKVYSG